MTKCSRVRVGKHFVTQTLKAEQTNYWGLTDICNGVCITVKRTLVVFLSKNECTKTFFRNFLRVVFVSLIVLIDVPLFCILRIKDYFNNKVFVIISPGTQKGGLGFGRRRKIIKSNKPQVHSCNQRRFLVLSVWTFKHSTSFEIP